MERLRLPACGAPWLAHWAALKPSATALQTPDGKAFTYKTLACAGAALAQHWAATGIEKGTRIAVLAENHPGLYVLFGACQQLGAILVPLNTRLSSSELKELLANAQPQRLYATAGWYAMANELGLAVDSVEGLTENAAELPTEPPVHATEDPLMLLYTSGTTGTPKGVIYTHGMLYYNAVTTVERFALTAADTGLHLMPPFHTGGWHVLPTPLFFAGGSLCLLPNFDAETVLAALALPGISLAMLVPTMCRMLSELPAFPAADLSHLRFIVVGGEALPVPLIEQWHAKGVAIRQGYGLTEAGPGITSLEAEDTLRKRGSIGTVNRHVQLRIVDENGQRCPPNTPGECQLAGPVVTPGYWQQPEATAAAFTTDGWFRTGDILKQDADGYYYVVDRLKHMYISGGENVYPAEVEALLAGYEGVAQLAITSVADAKWGEVGVALVVEKPGKPFDWEVFKTWASQRAARYKLPKRYKIVQQIPLNATGKIDRKALAKLAG